MNVKFRVLSAGVLFFVGSASMMAQSKKSDTLSKEKETTIEEVVLVRTGYNQTEAEHVTGAISTVTSKQIENTPGATVQQAMIGKVAGVDISFGSGQPGSSAFRVDMRGTTSIYGNNIPLYILDGVPISDFAFQTLDPNSIESISFVKDAAARAQYGSQGGAGVVILTTKKGRNRQKAIISYTGQYGASFKGNEKVQLMNSQQWNSYRRSIGLGNPYNLGTNGQPLPYTDSDIAALSGRNTNWKDMVFGTGVFSQHDFSVTGGSDKVSYYTQLGYLDQTGIIRSSDYKRMSATLNLSAKPSDRFSIDFNNSMSYGIRNGVSSEGATNLNNPVVALYLAPPSDVPYNADGSYNVGPNKVGGNALQTMNTRVGKRDEMKITSSVNMKYDLFKNVSIRQLIGIDHLYRVNEGYIDPNTYLGAAGVTGSRGSLSRSYIQYTSLINNTSINYSNTFGEKHALDASLLYEYKGKFSKNFGYTGYGLSDLYRNSPAAILVSDEFLPSISGGSTNYHLMGFLGQVNYVYDGKYSVQANVRRDGASDFGPNKKWGNFWGAGVSWSMDKENFVKSLGFINELKPRISYGETGNARDPFYDSPYQTSQYYGSGSYNGETTLVPTVPGNAFFQWEVGKELNAGIDFGFFKNRLTGSFDYYNKKVSQLYIQRNLSDTTGFSSIDNYNGGEMSNKGVEVQLNAKLIDTQNTTLSIFGNFAYNKNKILSLGGVSEFEAGTSVIRVGESFGSHYIVKWGGVDASNGQPLYYDVNGNLTNVYSASNNVTGFGSYKPEIWGGFGADFKYKNVSMTANFRYKAKYFRFNNQSYFMENPNFAQYNQSVDMLNMWTTPGQITDIQSYLYPRQFSSKDIEDASFLRLQEVRINYNIPKRIVGSFLSSIDLFVIANNLYTWTKWTGFDPDDDNNLASFEYPTPTTITFGCRVNF